LVTSLVVPKVGQHSGPQLEWTGERYVTSVGGEIEFEHTHRYLYALPFAEGATVLDIASGEGYGSALLGSVARRVIGIDIDESSVSHAKSKYKIDNASFIRGNCTEIPLSSDSIDLVVSFETLEHIIDHMKFFDEISRVLKPGGVLVISTPDRVPYNEMNGSANPYHLKELDRAEFKLLLKKRFKSVQLLGQCYLEGSLIDPLKGGGNGDRESKSEKRRWVRYLEEPLRARKGLARSIYLIAIACNQSLPRGCASLLTTARDRQPRWDAIRQTQNANEATTREADGLRATLAASEDQERALRAVVSDHEKAAAMLRADIEQRAATEAALRADIEQRAATEAALRADIEQAAETEAALRSALEMAAREAEAREARSEGAKAEITVLRDALAKAERSLQERRTAAEALQIEFEQARQRQRQHHSAVAALQAEIDSLRTELEQAERRQREGEAVGAMRQAEITSLRSELAAAREVGKAALGLLRTPPAPISEAPPRKVGWLQVVLRRFGLPTNYPLPSVQ
jgi:SAM-dependent methyltransferase